SLAVNVTLVAAPAAQDEGNSSGASSNSEAPSHTSEAMTRANQSWTRLSVFGTPPGLEHSRVMGAGTARSGGVVSATVMEEEREVLLPQLSAAVNVTTV